MALAALKKFEGQILALMRIVFGLLFACHGAQKLFGLLGGNQADLASMAGVAGIIEFVAGGMIALGIFAGYASFIASGQMAVAYFMVHFPRGFWPIQNGGELAVLYCFAFLYLAAREPKTWSIKTA